MADDHVAREDLTTMRRHLFEVATAVLGELVPPCIWFSFYSTVLVKKDIFVLV